MGNYYTQDDAPITVPAGTLLHFKATVGAGAATLESVAPAPYYRDNIGDIVYPKAVHLTAVTGIVWITLDGQTPDITGLGLQVSSSGALRMPYPAGISGKTIKIIADGAGKIVAVSYEF